MRLALALVALLVGPASADGPPPRKHGGGKARTTAPAVAPVKRDYAATFAPESATQHKEGEYGGVEPGQTPTGPGKHKTPPKNTLNWIGFEAKDSGATVFFQAAAPFEVTQHVEGATLVAELSLPHLGANTWRQVDTRFFDNPLSGIVAKTAKAHGIEVRFSFKTAADAKVAAMRTATEPDGQYYVYLTFPPGSGPAMTPTTATPKKPDAEN